MKAPGWIRPLLYLRGLAPLIWLPLWTVALSLPVLWHGFLKAWDRQTWWMNLWCRGVLWAVGVRVQCSGQERLPTNGGAIVVFNHQSHFDIPALTGSVQARLRYGAKAELYRIPLFGQVLEASGNLPIARQSREKVLALYRASIHRLQTGGFSFALAPEGTRQPTNQIGTFKRGPFLFAFEARCPVIPVVIEGAYDVLPKQNWLPNLDCVNRVVRVEILKPILFSDAPKNLNDNELTEWMRSTAEQKIRECFNALSLERRAFEQK